MQTNLEQKLLVSQRTVQAGALIPHCTETLQSVEVWYCNQCRDTSQQALASSEVDKLSSQRRREFVMRVDDEPLLLIIGRNLHF